jgi:hypothetical protein
MPGEKFAPVLGRLQRLVTGLELGGLVGPVDRQVELADFTSSEHVDNP